MTVSMVIFGKPISSTNSKVQAVSHGRAFSHKSAAFKKYAADFIAQVPTKYRNLNMGSMRKPLRCIMTVYFPTWQGDLETKGIYDLLQAAGVIKNDLYVIEQIHYRAIDKVDPRCEIVVEEV